MKTLTAILAISFSAFVASAGDTTYIKADHLCGIYADYILKAFPINNDDWIWQLRYDNPDIMNAVSLWLNTKEGYSQTFRDRDWPAKYESFLRMYPGYRSRYDVVKHLVRWSIHLDIYLFKYAYYTDVVLVNGQLDGLRYNRGGKTENYTPLSNSIFRKLYETGKDTDGVSWKAKILQVISDHFKK